MNIRTLAIAAAITCTGHSYAADYFYGDVTSLAVSDVIYLDSQGQFTDHHFFSVNSFSTGNLLLGDNQFAPFLDIAGINVDLWFDFGTTDVVDGADLFYINIGSGDLIANSGPLPTGSYYFEVSGNVGGTGLNIDPSDAGLEYGAYFFNASAVPIPEPQTWAMLLAGVGIIGLQLRRKMRGAGKLIPR